MARGWKVRLRRSSFALIAVVAAWLAAGAAGAAPRRPAAAAAGAGCRAWPTGRCAQALQQAVGESQGPPANRIEARRRARQAADSVTELLRSDGYYDATVKPDIGDGDRPAGVVKIDLGPLTKLTEPTLAWLGAPPSDAVEAAARKAVKLKPGGAGRAVDVIAGEGRAVAALAQAGYADAKASPREVVVDHADHTMHPTFRIAAGALVKMGPGCSSPGGTRTNPRWLHRLAPLEGARGLQARRRRGAGTAAAGHGRLRTA